MNDYSINAEEGIALKGAPFLEHLPEIYMNDSLLMNIVTVMQNMFLEIEQAVDDLPDIYDSHKTPSEFIGALSELAGFDNYLKLEDEKHKRALITSYFSSSRRRGTAKSIIYAVKTYLDEMFNCDIAVKVEDGKESGKFTVSIGCGPVPFDSEKDNVIKIVDHFKPDNTTAIITYLTDKKDLQESPGVEGGIVADG